LKVVACERDDFVIEKGFEKNRPKTGAGRRVGERQVGWDAFFYFRKIILVLDRKLPEQMIKHISSASFVRVGNLELKSISN
jgi:hypothetical protein